MAMKGNLINPILQLQAVISSELRMNTFHAANATWLCKVLPVPMQTTEAPARIASLRTRRTLYGADYARSNNTKSVSFLRLLSCFPNHKNLQCVSPGSLLYPLFSLPVPAVTDQQ